MIAPLSSKRRTRTGFSLLEIIVACLIIAVLASIAQPVLARAVLSAKSSTSLAQLRQIHVAITLYRSDWETGGTTPSQLGLPPLNYQGAPSVSMPQYDRLWDSPCGLTRDAPHNDSVGRIYAIYQFMGADREEWHRLYLTRGENTIFVLDEHCSPPPRPERGSQFTRKTFNVLRLSGQVQSLRSHGVDSAFEGLR